MKHSYLMENQFVILYKLAEAISKIEYFDKANFVQSIIEYYEEKNLFIDYNRILNKINTASNMNSSLSLSEKDSQNPFVLPKFKDITDILMSIIKENTIDLLSEDLDKTIHEISFKEHVNPEDFLIKIKTLKKTYEKTILEKRVDFLKYLSKDSSSCSCFSSSKKAYSESLEIFCSKETDLIKDKNLRELFYAHMLKHEREYTS